MDVLQWICALAGLVQVILLIYVFSSKRLDTPWYYVSDALKQTLYVRTVLSMTMYIQIIIGGMYIVFPESPWAVVAAFSGTGILCGWVVLTSWDESTPAHDYGVGIFLISIIAYFTIHLSRTGEELWKQVAKCKEKTIWVISAAIYLGFFVVLGTFLTDEFGSTDPTMYEWMSFIIGGILFIIVTLTSPSKRMEAAKAYERI